MPTKLQEATRHKKHTSTHTHTHTVFDRDRSTTEEGIATATQLLRPAAAAAMFDARLLALVATTAASHSQANAPPSVSSFFALFFFFLFSFSLTLLLFFHVALYGAADVMSLQRRRGSSIALRRRGEGAHAAYLTSRPGGCGPNYE